MKKYFGEQCGGFFFSFLVENSRKDLKMQSLKPKLPSTFFFFKGTFAKSLGEVGIPLKYLAE